MANNPLSLSNVGTVDAVDEVVATVNVGDLKSVKRVAIDSLALQLAGTAPITGIAAGVEAETERATSAEAALDERLTANEALALAGAKPAKQSVRVLTKTNLNLATLADNGKTIDGIVVVTGDRIVKAYLGDTTGDPTNGPYIVQAAGAAVRATDMDTSNELLGATFSVDAGTYAGEVYGITNVGAITVGTTPLTIVKQAAANPMAGEVTAGRAGEANLKARDDARQAKRGTNLVRYPRLDGGPYNLKFVNNAGTQLPGPVETSLPSFRSREIEHVYEFPAASSGLFQYIPAAAEKARLLGSQLCGWFIGHTTDVAPPGAVARLVGGSGGGSRGITLAGGGGTLGRIQIDNQTWFFYVFGQMPAVGAAYLATAADLLEICWGYTSNPSATTFSVSEAGIAVRDAAWTVGDIPALVKSLRDKRTEEPKPGLTLNGPGPAESWFSVPNGGHTIKRSFRLPMLPATIAPQFGGPVVSISEDSIDGEVFRTMTDDIAPDGLLNKLGLPPSHHGGLHGYVAGLMTTTAPHGKTALDIGQVSSNGGNQYGVVAVPSTTTIVLARRGPTDALPPTGVQAFNYVEGGSNTSNLATTAMATQTWHPMVAGYEKTLSAGGRDLDKDVGFWEADEFGVRERYRVISRESAVEWLIDNGNASVAGISGDDLFWASHAYDFDKFNRMFLYGSLLPLQDLNARWMYATQVQNSGATGIYLPGVLPFTHDGIDYDFAMIDTADAPTTQIEITPAMCVAAPGPLADTIMTMNDDFIMAVGILPVLDGEPTVRRTDMIPADAAAGRYNIAMQGATTGKWYPRIWDRNYYHAGPGNPATFTMEEGALRSWAAYRVVQPRVAERTFASALPSKLGDFYRADWHDKQGIDHLPIPQEYAGREFSVVYKSDNVEPIGDVAMDSILVDRDAVGENAYMMLKFEPV